MAEKVVSEKKVEEKVDETVDETTEEVSSEELVKTDKAFTQSDVNKIVTTRLKKVKSEYEEQISNLETQISEYETTLQKMIDAQSKDLPENVKKLLKKLSVSEQLEYLADDTNMSTEQKKKIPTTPKEEKNDKNSNKPTKHLSGWK